MFVDGDKRTSLLANFDEMVQKYVEDAILIPDISGLFVFSKNFIVYIYRLGYFETNVSRLHTEA